MPFLHDNPSVKVNLRRELLPRNYIELKRNHFGSVGRDCVSARLASNSSRDIAEKICRVHDPSSAFGFATWEPSGLHQQLRNDFGSRLQHLHTHMLGELAPLPFFDAASRTP